MGTSWNDLSAAQLSELAASPLSKNEGKLFAEHLERYGQDQDFANWIEQKDSPFNTALNSFAHCPKRAQPWLIDVLDTTARADWHYAAVTHLAYYGNFKNGIPPQSQDVLAHVKYDILPLEDLQEAFTLLLYAKMFGLLENKWAMFNSVVQAEPQKALLHAASVGWDLQEKMKCSPADELKYFRACCAGGLLERVKEYSADPSETRSINQAFVAAAVRSEIDPKTMSPILHHLWDTYPTQPWHNAIETFGVVVHAPPAIVQKIVEHYQKYAPEEFTEHAAGIVEHAIYTKKQQLFTAMLPHIDAAEHSKLFCSAIIHKRKSFLKTLLQRCAPISGHEGFFAALENCDDKQKQWAEKVYSEQQKHVLQSKIQNSRQSVGVVQQKKM